MKRRDTGKILDEFFAVLSSSLESVTTDCLVKQFAVARLLTRMRKRANIQKPGLTAAACNDFVATNSAMGHLVPHVDEDVLTEARGFISRALENFTSSVNSECIQEVLCPDYFFSRWRFGPGSSNGIKGTHAAEKISSVFSCTALAEPFVLSLRRRNLYLTAFDGHGSGGTSLVNGSKITTVPKNEDCERTIAIEPLGNMALQLAAGRYLEGVLSHIGLNINSQQPRNKLLARRGSIDDTLCTVDLKSASDRIHPDLVRLLMPDSWYQLLMRLRSPVAEVPGHGEVRLNMISTMGNGFTFPLMTLILISLIYAYRRCSGGPRNYINWKNTAVFGDDIIVPASEYPVLVRVLTSAGFIVNDDKSYVSGPFRESCGGDYYQGVDVTPFYVRSLSTYAAIYTAINQLLLWSGKHRINVYLPLKFLVQLLDKKVLLVPEWMNPDQGILTSGCPRRFRYLSFTSRMIKRDSDLFDLMLCVGGYLAEAPGKGTDLFYTPRDPRGPEVHVRKARLPNGYLDGWSPDRGSAEVSSWVSLMVSLVV